MFSKSDSTKLRFLILTSSRGFFSISPLYIILGKLYTILSCYIKGDSIVRDSNRSGWLHTFLNCMSTFMMLKKSLSLRVCLVLSLLIYSSYSSLYRLDRLHYTICSTFSGSCFSTSLFKRLNKKGLSILYNF
jgi:hypothetical protein